ncbi:MAG: DUF308 domain-containing protein [Caldilineaceae bacterium]|nr:DUF308 domain-containing protein [Caldilineaceae bacterium]
MTTQQPAVTPATLWWMPLIRGIILIIFGLMMFAWGRGVTLLLLIQFFGAYWLVGGVFDLFEGIMGRTEGSRIWSVISAIISIVAGFFVMGHPIISGLIASTYIVYFMGFAAIVVGVIQIFAGREKGQRSWGRRIRGVFLGVFYIIFGVIVVFNPVMTQVVIITLLQLWALVAGISSVVAAIALRRSTS